MTDPGETLVPADRALLLQLQRQALEYFLDNQAPGGLVFDRQRNHGPRRAHGLCSTASTGMGFIALALGSAPPHQLLSPQEAAQRIATTLETVLDRLPHERGMVPHFIDPATHDIYGSDYFSTVETAWLAAGALWAAAFLDCAKVQDLADCLYDRIDWSYWASPENEMGAGLLRHGKDREGRFLTCCWDRLNGETTFMYVLAAGAADGRALPAPCWEALKPFYGSVAGLRFNNADLGLFVFQYGLDLLDLDTWQPPGPVDLAAEARLATQANHLACRQTAATFATYRRYWGLSAGDGPGSDPEHDIYRCYAPLGPVDGTAHLTAALASVAHHPGPVLENLHQAQADTQCVSRGRYGFSNLNMDRGWVARDMVGIDAGAAVLALDNYLADNRVRTVFHGLPCVAQGLQRLGFARALPPTSPDILPEQPAAVRRAS
jgi:hypothetical protein